MGKRKVHARNRTLGETVKRFLSVGVFVYFFSVFAHTMPASVLPWKNIIDEWNRPWMLWTGLWQGWDMFASPRRENVFIEAKVIGADGVEMTWKFPRMEQLGYWDSYQKERYRKWANDHVRVDADSGLWLPTAQFVARKVCEQPSAMSVSTAETMRVPPREIQLIRYWGKIEIPDAEKTAWKKNVYFTYAVPPDFCARSSEKGLM